MKALLDVTKDALELPSEHRFALARILLDVGEGDDSPRSCDRGGVGPSVC